MLCRPFAPSTDSGLLFFTPAWDSLLGLILLPALFSMPLFLFIPLLLPLFLFPTPSSYSCPLLFTPALYSLLLLPLSLYPLLPPHTPYSLSLLLIMQVETESLGTETLAVFFFFTQHATVWRLLLFMYLLFTCDTECVLY